MPPFPARPGSPTATPPTSSTIGRYLADRLHELGVSHVFGVPGPHCGDWLHSCVEENSSLRRLGVTNALNAGYAADGYARLNGIGAACVPYGVGTLNMVNAVAGAYGERVPLVVITCAPGERSGSRRARNSAQSSLRVYSEFTCAAERISDPEYGTEIIDRTLLACRSYRQPVYIELTTDVCSEACSPPTGSIAVSPPPLSETTPNEIVVDLQRADSPLIWAGAEIQRYGLEESFDRLLRCLDVPYVTTLLAKGMLPETHDHFAGVFDEHAPEPVERLVRNADYILGLGVVDESCPSEDRLRSFGNLRMAYRGGSNPRVSDSDDGEARKRVRSNVPLGRLFSRLRRELAEARSSSRGAEVAARTRAAVERDESGEPTSPDEKITYSGFFSFIEEYVGDETIVMSGNGLDRLGCQMLPVRDNSGFVCQAAYGDVGHVTPASIGTTLASDHDRVLLFVGDGGFQMTASCFGTMAENGIDPIIFVLNNGVYGSEEWRSNRETFEFGAPFTPQTILQHWHYWKLPDATGGKGWHADTYGQLGAALEEAQQYIGGPLLIDVRLEQRSLPALATNRIELPDETLDIAVETLLPKSS